MKTCDQCVSTRINGIFTHEHGCPNKGKKWDRFDERWIKVIECPECGCDVEEGTSCSCSELEDFDPEDEEIEELTEMMDEDPEKENDAFREYLEAGR